MQNFFLALPVPMVNLLGKSAEFCNTIRLALMRDLVFNPIGESVVEAPAKSSVTPVSDLTCQVVPFYNVFSDPLTITHLQSLKLSFCVSHLVVGAEVSLKFIEEVIPMVHP